MPENFAFPVRLHDSQDQEEVFQVQRRGRLRLSQQRHQRTWSESGRPQG